MATGDSADRGPIEMVRRLGEGSFGVVYKAHFPRTGEVVAVKTILLDKYGNVNRARDLISREIKFLQKLKHDNILGCIAVQHWSGDQPQIWMPLMSGNLTYLRERLPAVELETYVVKDVLEQMLCSLDYLACRKVIHRDLNPDNILYWETGPTKYTFKLADFGLAMNETVEDKPSGTPRYMAPETMPQFSKINARQSHKLDVWALIATIADISPTSGFPGKMGGDYVTKETMEATWNAVVNLVLHFPFNAMKYVDPNKRASAAQVLLYGFQGRGLTTKRRIPPLIDESQPGNPNPQPVPGGSGRVLAISSRALGSGPMDICSS
ncbi:kinase-like domain-containing protein [Xylariaceae sp. FL0594]|nr:kinase-like domain-containing protein [Xylariaceae sp. FL0594]